MHKAGSRQPTRRASAFAPKELRQGRHVVTGFTTLQDDESLAFSPDLVITFSDVQTGISAELIRDHCTVLATNQRSLREIGEAILLNGRAIGCPKEAEALLK